MAERNGAHFFFHVDLPERNFIIAIFAIVKFAKLKLNPGLACLDRQTAKMKSSALVLQHSMASTTRATCWSITINNPVEEDYSVQLPGGWELKGQIEQGKEGTVHYQGCLTTPQVRFSAVKRYFPKAHIEIARNKKALQAYVQKDETRVATVDTNVGLTVFKLQDLVLDRWDDEVYKKVWENNKHDTQTAHLSYADCLVRELIEEGLQGGVEYVAVNPMWRTSWKLYGESLVIRYKNLQKEKESLGIV